ncbi:hypothetical protein [Rhizobium ruizarguesonis]|uniref:hypothetical protein n=1 Tax=Rhizobium ruizarguesonis TaxID=2081791 RepID=UPI0005182147|nr:hypothetical protein [Rhizobium ruizarguesonis]
MTADPAARKLLLPVQSSVAAVTIIVIELTGYIGSEKTVLHRQRSKLQLIENERRIIGVDILTVRMHVGLSG